MTFIHNSDQKYEHNLVLLNNLLVPNLFWDNLMNLTRDFRSWIGKYILH